MVDLVFERDIKARADDVFSLLIDLRSYDRWLPMSSAFHGTSQISEGPIDIGTTYVEPGPFGTRHGVVTALVRPTRLDFEQPMTLRPAFLGVIGIKLFYKLTPGTGSVHVLRKLELTPRGPIGFAMGPVISAFRAENERMMDTLKSFVERGGR